MIGTALLMGLIVYLFNRALTTIVSTSCSHGTSCPMWGTINFQTNIGILIMVLIILLGIYFLFSEQISAFFKKKELALERKEPINPEKYSLTLSELIPEEKTVFEKIIEAQGAIFQSELVEKSGFTKVKVTRILDKLEGRGLIERKRRGMTNVVILKR